MKYCPICRSEFHDVATHCPNCETDLVESLEQARPVMTEDEISAWLSQRKTLALSASGYDNLKSVKESLINAHIPCLIARDVPDSGCCATGGCGQNDGFLLILAEEDLEEAQNLFEKHRERMIRTVDAPDAQKAADSIVDLGSGGDIQCPACGTTFASGTEECPECGLYVGVPEGLFDDDDDEEEAE